MNIWRKLIGEGFKAFFRTRIKGIQRFMDKPLEAQEKVFHRLVQTAKHTEWGRQHRYGQIKNYEDFRKLVPVSSYEAFQPWIERCMKGEPDVIWPGTFTWFSKSSGTTNAKSKFIPVSEESLHGCHYKAGMDMAAWYVHLRPDTKLYSGHGLSVGGTYYTNHLNANSWYGDISAVIMKNLPPIVRNLRKPGLEIALMDKWEDKMEAMAQATAKEDITSIHGVPTWMIVLLNKIVERQQADSILDVWPNLELFLHGAVAFGPYRELFKRLLPSEKIWYLENYNASEGYFAFQDDLSRFGQMCLFTDHGIFYEFIPMEELGKPEPKVIPLAEVEEGVSYALVISTNAGLWRYLIGDTVKFTSTKPYRIAITGRTKHFINAFGEEVVVENAEGAITEACQATGATVADFTAAPFYMGEQSKGGHEWIIEFEETPDNLEKFTQTLDQALQNLNSDYEAKRYKDMALQMPKINVAEPGTFYEWMRRRGKLGGQNKVPRLSNNREFLDDILELIRAKA